MSDEVKAQQEVYVVALAGIGEISWYILDKKNWKDLDDVVDLCEQIDTVEHLATPMSLQDLFDTLKENNWTVEDSAEGVQY